MQKKTIEISKHTDRYVLASDKGVDILGLRFRKCDFGEKRIKQTRTSHA